jgi:hypothetical protein
LSSLTLIPYDEFKGLRLTQLSGLPFSPADPSDPGSARRFDEDVVAELSHWRYMEKDWIGEAIGFTEWLRLRKDPDILRSMALSLNEQPDLCAKALERIKLPLRKGMKQPAVVKLLGRPTETHGFGSDRVTLDFTIGKKESYEISCTIDASDGLVYVVVMRGDWRKVRAAPKARG